MKRLDSAQLFDTATPGDHRALEKMGFPVPLDRWMRDGKSTIFSEVSDGRCKHFVDVDQFARDFDTLDALFIWRIHQIARWMKLYDL